MEDRQAKAILWGHPSYGWGFGQERRLSLVRRHVDLAGRRILDVGCGVGVYVRAFRRFSPLVYGVDVDLEKVAEAHRDLPNLCLAVAEQLPFRDNSFDMVFLHEVLEHVADDRLAIAEAHRTTRPGGQIVIYAPNRWYPFETHGFYWRGRYIYRLLPFVNYLPRWLRDRLCPHARIYGAGDLRRLFEGLAIQITVHTFVFPAFDRIARRHRRWAALLRRILYALENTPLRIFGLSHFLVATKLPPGHHKSELA